MTTQTRNRLPGALSKAEYDELAARTEYTKYNNQCPTCTNGQYVYKGGIYMCPLDYDGQHIQRKLFQRYELANIPMRYQRFNFEVDFTEQPDAKELVDEYVANIDNAIRNGLGYYIYSPGLGSGKTAIATHVVKSAVKRAYDRVFHDCWFDSFFNLVATPQLDPDDRSFIERKYMDSHLLVIDDVTPGKVSAKQENYFADILERVIRHRAHGGLATIVTTNMTPDDLKGSYGRIFSLLADSCMELRLNDTTDSRIARGVNDLMRLSLKGEVAPIT